MSSVPSNSICAAIGCNRTAVVAITQDLPTNSVMVFYLCEYHVGKMRNDKLLSEKIKLHGLDSKDS